MGSTSPPTPPQPPPPPTSTSSTSSTCSNNKQQIDNKEQPTVIASTSDTKSEPTIEQVRLQLEIRDQEIQALKFKLEKYKLALQQSQLDYRYIQQQLLTTTTTALGQQQSSVETTAPGTSDCGSNSLKSVDNISKQLIIDKNNATTKALKNNKIKARKERHQTLTDIGAFIGDYEDEVESNNDRDILNGEDDDGYINDDDIIIRQRDNSELGNESNTDSDAVLILDSSSSCLNKQQKDNDQEEEDEDELLKSLVKCRDKISTKTSTPKVLFELSANDDEDDDDDLDDIINDVNEIDLDLELDEEEDRKNRNKVKITKVRGIKQGEQDGNDDDEDIISDGLLTSLTDAAINNLNQLAALQERCESQQNQLNQSSTYQQQQQQQHKPQQATAATTTTTIPKTKTISGISSGVSGNKPTVISAANVSHTSPAPAPLSGLVSSLSSQQQQQQQPVVRGIDYNPQGVVAAAAALASQDPYSASAIANQAAIAINAAAVAAGLQGQQPAIALLSQQQQQLHNQQQQPISSSSSISPTSTIQTDLNSSHSLARVVAAAAIAAAAANDQNIHNGHVQLNPQSRLISSAIQSPDFYHTLQQQQRQQQQHHLQHAQHPQNSSQQQQQLTSSPAGLHFSPSTSVTPSPSSLMAHSARRSITGSNATTASSASLMSPISSPNYLRRQFMPDRLPILSPSPSSGLTTGSSGTGSSLAHVLQHHHHSHQQRSVSALAGGTSTMMTTPSSTGTPLSTSAGSTAVSPLMSNKNSSQARLNNMQIRHKFGYLGSGRAQFNSPHGFCLGLNQEIVVADTNNHRICIFDKSGTYITQFGSPGKEEGQLWNPRKVAILHRSTNNGSSTTTSPLPISNHPLINNNSNLTTHHQHQLTTYSTNQQNLTSNNNNNTNQLQNNGNSEPLYVVCDRGAERSRMQLFTKDGTFIKKIGIHYIDIVAGLAITQNGLIIVVDSVSPTVYIIDGDTGTLNGWFDCSGHMKEPSDIAVKCDLPAGNEYFICDFKGHCVVVFSEQGEYLRKIGHDGLTSYPNGIDISDDGDILVGDSHGNRFHVVVFDRNGKLIIFFQYN